MKLSKSLSKILAGVAVGSALFFGNPKSASADTPLYLYNKIAVDYSPIGTNFANINSKFSLSPSVSGDPTNFFIGNFSLEDNFGIGFEKENFNFKIGPTLRWSSFFNPITTTDNQYGSQGGSSNGNVWLGNDNYSALRKSSKFPSNSKFLPTPGVSAEIDYLFENGLDCFLEYSTNFFEELSFENGLRTTSQGITNGIWADHIDYTYNPNETFPLADLIEHRIKLGISGPFKKVGLFLELYFPQIMNPTDSTKEKGLTVFPSISLGTFFQLTNEKGNKK